MHRATATATAALTALVAALLAAPPPLAAAPLRADQVPASADLVIHVDVDALRGSGLRRLLQPKLDALAKEIDSELAKKKIPLRAADIASATGFTFWAAGDDTDKGALIVNGLDTARLLRALPRLPGFKTARAGGHNLMVISDGDDTYIGRAGGALVLGSDKGAVATTLDVLDGRGKSKSSSEVARRLGRAGGLLVAAVFDTGIAEKIRKQADSPLFRNVGFKRGAVLVRERQNRLAVEVVVESKSAAGAAKLEKLATAGLSFVQLAVDEPALAELAKHVQVRSRGASVSLSAELSYATLKKLAPALGSL